MKLINHLYQKYPEVLLLIAGILVFLTNLDALFVNIMEARNFITAREMLVHDNWIFTTMNEMPRYQKPPLPTWLTAISAYIFGENSLYANRLPAALSSIFLMLIFFRIQLKLNIHKALAFGASIILSTSFYIFFAGREGQWDIFTHSFMAASIYFLIKVLSESGKVYRNSIFAGFFLGASVMSKGPVSLYALFLPFLISYGICYNYKDLSEKLKPLLLFLLIGLVTGTWWTIIVTYYDPGEFTRIAEIESTRWFNYNIRPFYYYWSFFTQSGIWTIPAFAGLLYPYMISRVSNPKAYMFFFLWTVISVILLSVIPEKKSRYLLPVLIPLAATTAFYAEYVIKNFRTRFTRIEKIPVYLNFGILALISIIAPFVLYYFAGDNLLEKKFLFAIFSLFLLLWGFGFIFGIAKSKMKLLFALQAGLIMLVISFGFPLLKLVDPAKNTANVTGLKSIANQEGLPVYDYNNMIPELVWHFENAIPVIEKGSPPPQENEFILLVEEETLPQWQLDFQSYEIQKLGELDLNPTYATGTNLRLIRNYYLVRRQEP